MDKVLFSSDRMDWETPSGLFNELNTIYEFDIDVAASEKNHKCESYFTKEDNALDQVWEGNIFCNPPYGRDIKNWLKKGYEEHLRDPERFIVFLIPSRTDTTYWHDYIFNKAHIDFIKGRLKFEVGGVPSKRAPFQTTVIV